jgi:hypothetical protein
MEFPMLKFLPKLESFDIPSFPPKSTWNCIQLVRNIFLTIFSDQISPSQTFFIEIGCYTLTLWRFSCKFSAQNWNWSLKQTTASLLIANWSPIFLTSFQCISSVRDAQNPRKAVTL